MRALAVRCTERFTLRSSRIVALRCMVSAARRASDMRIRRALKLEGTDLVLRFAPALLGSALVSWPVQAAVPEYVIPIRWCGVERAPLLTDPNVLRQLSKKKAGFLEETADPGQSNASAPLPELLSPDAALRARSGNAKVIEAFAREDTSIVFHATTPNSELGEGRMAQSFPILPIANWGADSGFVFGEAMAQECQKAWQGGDALYFDVDGDNKVSVKDIRLLAGNLNHPSGPVRSECSPNFGAPLEQLAESVFMKGVKYGYVDDNNSGGYDLKDSIYRFEDGPNDPQCGGERCVTSNDILLYPVGLPGPRLPRDVPLNSEVKNYNPEHLRRNAALLPFDGTEKVKYVDLIREPGGEFSIGFGTLEATGVYAVSTNDYEMEASAGAKCRLPGRPPENEFVQYPTLGHSLGYTQQITVFGKRMLTRSDIAQRIDKDNIDQSCAPQPIVVDDPVWMIEQGVYKSFEPILVAHELGHALGLPHGDGVDNDGNNLVDDKKEKNCTPDTCSSPPGERADLKDGKFSRTTCFVEPGIGPDAPEKSNMMQYCWNFEQDEDFKKSRLGKDHGFDGKLDFSDAQYKAMQTYADECGFRVAATASAKEPVAGAEAPGAERTHRIERVDGWDDTFGPGLSWLDIGRYGYSVTQVSGTNKPLLKFRVSFSQNLRGVVEPFELWLGVEALPREHSNPGREDATGALPAITRPETIDASLAQASVFIKAVVSADATVKTSFFVLQDEGFAEFEGEEVQGRFVAIETPNGFVPPNYQGPLVRGHALELSIPEGIFPVALENSFSLLAMSVAPKGRVADVAFSSAIRNEPPERPGSTSSINPTCVVTSVNGTRLEKMPRSGRLKIEARGLTADRPVLLDLNGVRVSDIRPFARRPSAKPGDPVMTDAQGRVTLLVDGDEVPFHANREAGVPAVISVGAGASTAICGFKFYDSAEPLDWDCALDVPSNSDNPEADRYSCHYEHMCEPGRFAYVKPPGKYCPDGSLAKAAELDLPMLSCTQGEPVCLVPVGPHGEPNCFNTVFNLPPGADWSVSGLGFAYNFMVWTWDGRACTNRSLSRLGLDFHAPAVRSRCLPDPDGDGIPSLTDWCPDHYGFCYYDWESKTLKFLGECTPT